MRLLLAAIATGATMFPVAARAVIVYGPQARNVGAPTGTLSTAGYQYEGTQGFGLGTPIAPNYFITAAHYSGGLNSTFTYQGVAYTVIDDKPSPTTDLRILKVDGTFPSYAPLYTPSDGSPVGKQMFVTGRGNARGDPIYLPIAPTAGNIGVATSALLPGSPATGTQSTQRQIGWGFKDSDAAITWGTNTVDSVLTFQGPNSFLTFDFDSNAGDNESTLAYGDSSGGVFVYTGGVWKLAGINRAIDDFYYTLTGGTSNVGAIFDSTGTYVYDPFLGTRVYGAKTKSYASSISDSSAWIQSVIGGSAGPIVPEPTSAAVIGAAMMLLRRRRSMS